MALGDAILGAFLTNATVVSNRKGPPHDPPSGGPFVSLSPVLPF